MRNLKTKLAAIILSVAGLTSSVQADCWDPCNDCCLDFEIGADWLYWTPCINDQHFAIVGQESPTSLKTYYLCDEWDSGVRVWGKLDNFWNCFSGALFYTYINPKSSGSVTSELTNFVIFSNSTPAAYDAGESLTSNWDLEYQTVDAVLSYSIDVTQNRCLSVEAFSGLTWIDVTQKRTDILTGVDTEVESTYTFDRHNDFWAIGPCFGLNTSLRICDCFYLFGTFKTSLVVGESDSKDVFTQAVGSTQPIDFDWKAKDECFCFPGIHLATGIDYELCICDFSFGIRAGWEYVQWINAPTFPYYEFEELGVRSAPSTNDLTMQGIFVGLHASF